MKVFVQSDLHAAMTYARHGGLAIHLHFIVFADSPQCFKRDVAAGLPIAHVFHSDSEFLRRLAKSIGINKVYIDREGSTRQHLDVCGTPLQRLLAMAGEDVKSYRRQAEGDGGEREVLDKNGSGVEETA